MKKTAFNWTSGKTETAEAYTKGGIVDLKGQGLNLRFRDRQLYKTENNAIVAFYCGEFHEVTPYRGEWVATDWIERKGYSIED